MMHGGNMPASALTRMSPQAANPLTPLYKSNRYSKSAKTGNGRQLHRNHRDTVRPMHLLLKALLAILRALVLPRAVLAVENAQEARFASTWSLAAGRLGETRPGEPS